MNNLEKLSRQYRLDFDAIQVLQERSVSGASATVFKGRLLVKKENDVSLTITVCRLLRLLALIVPFSAPVHCNQKVQDGG